ncbi:MAG TPA: hypothetical protein VF815_38580 [Myxococcaceae bacterium]|jgi:hypothetical protein
MEADGEDVVGIPAEASDIALQHRLLSGAERRLDSNGLVITVKEGATEFDVTGHSLGSLLLEFTSAEVHFTMKFIPQGSENGVPMYQAAYTVSGDAWHTYCGNGLEQSAFLPPQEG